MPKPRSHRKDLRQERKRKHEEENGAVAYEATTSTENTHDDGPYSEAKRVRRDDDQGFADEVYFDDEQDRPYRPPLDDDLPNFGEPSQASSADREFFGMLTDQEQEYFRSTDEMLEVNNFDSDEDRNIFVQNVFHEARGKELKLACSQSCSRLMERMILLSSPLQKKRLFCQFSGHFLSLIQHRFASHCCETLFLQSAAVIAQELSGFTPPAEVTSTKTKTSDGEGEGEGEEEDEEEQKDDDEPMDPADEDARKTSMEDLFLMALDELEGQFSSLLTDRFASHSLRVLLLVLSGRPLSSSAAKSLMKSKKKERIFVPGAITALTTELMQQTRNVPPSFGMAVRKIIADSTVGMDATALRILVRHPTGNPLLQLLLELDIDFNVKADKAKSKEASKEQNKKKKNKKGKKDAEETRPTEETNNKDDSESSPQEPSLLQKLLPDAPSSLSDPKSSASDFVSVMMYDSIGSRIIEVLAEHAPGSVFKALKKNFFLPRIESYVRNEVACYPAQRALVRMSKEDLATSMEKILPTVPALVERARYSVLKTLLECCRTRELPELIAKLRDAIIQGCGSNDPKVLIPSLCYLRDKSSKKDKTATSEEIFEEQFQKFQLNTTAAMSHGAQLVNTMLSITGPASRAAQTSLLGLTEEELVKLATTNMTTMTILVTALEKTSLTPTFHRSLVATLIPQIANLAQNQFGHNVINAIIAVPSKAPPATQTSDSDGKKATGKTWTERPTRVVPFFMKENVMRVLASQERNLRDTWMGRSVWRTWRGDIWKTQRPNWIKWVKEQDGLAELTASTPQARNHEQTSKAASTSTTQSSHTPHTRTYKGQDGDNSHKKHVKPDSSFLKPSTLSASSNGPPRTNRDFALARLERKQKKLQEQRT